MLGIRSALEASVRELRIVLEAGVDARKEARDLDPALASCNVGPYERTRWLDNAAKNLSKAGPVLLTKDTERRNYFDVAAKDGTIQFLPLFGSRELDGTYTVHNKGPEKDSLASLQMSLFEGEEFIYVPAYQAPDPVSEELHGYAIRVAVLGEDGEDFELHMIWGSTPENASKTAVIRPYGEPFIVTRKDDGEGALEPVYTSPFSPEGA